MLQRKTNVLAVAFFCTVGWVCSGSAFGASGENPANGADRTEQVPDLSAQNADPDPGADADPDAAEEAAEKAARRGVRVGRFDTVSLNVQSTDLAQVLQLLSIQGQRNIVPSPKVAGTVTANLYDVTFHEALDAILQQNGAGYIERDNFIFVHTLEELREIQDAERQIVHHVFRLDYLTAEDASSFIEPLISSAGAISLSTQVGAGFQPTESDGGANSYAHEEMLIVHDYEENIEQITRVIESLDTRPQQVLVEATILQASLTEQLEFGVDLAVLADIGLDSVTGGPLNVVSDLMSGAIQTTPSGGMRSGVGQTDAPGGVKAGILTNHVAAFIRALDEITDTTVLANPKVLALNRQRAEVHVGERVAYLSTTATATATTQTVSFLDTGTQLTLRPFVSSDGMIRIELKPSISDFRLRESAGQTLPDEITQELTTNVMVRDGQTIVLGGLFKEETRVARRQVPFLGDVPVLGNAFKGRDDSVNRSEVIFLITPHIVKEDALAEAGAAAMEGIQQVRFGAREGLLPWSRSKMSASHLRDALDAMESGDRDKALWKVDLALGLDPSFAEARRLKERLTGHRTYWPKRDLLDDAVDMMIEEQTGVRRPDVGRPPVQPNPDPARMRQRGVTDTPNGAGAEADQPGRPADRLQPLTTPRPRRGGTTQAAELTAADPEHEQAPEAEDAKAEAGPKPDGEAEDAATSPAPQDEEPDAELAADESPEAEPKQDEAQRDEDNDRAARPSSQGPPSEAVRFTKPDDDGDDEAKRDDEESEASDDGEAARDAFPIIDLFPEPADEDDEAAEGADKAGQADDDADDDVSNDEDKDDAEDRSAVRQRSILHAYSRAH